MGASTVGLGQMVVVELERERGPVQLGADR
jgi:hypothetical protein